MKEVLREGQLSRQYAHELQPTMSSGNEHKQIMYARTSVDITSKEYATRVEKKARGEDTTCDDDDEDDLGENAQEESDDECIIMQGGGRSLRAKPKKKGGSGKKNKNKNAADGENAEEEKGPKDPDQELIDAYDPTVLVAGESKLGHKLRRLREASEALAKSRNKKDHERAARMNKQIEIGQDAIKISKEDQILILDNDVFVEKINKLIAAKTRFTGTNHKAFFKRNGYLSVISWNFLWLWFDLVPRNLKLFA